MVLKTGQSNSDIKKIILFTGGGSGGHVLPALTLINELRKRQSVEIRYIGSKQGIEKELALSQDLKYFGISTGKLRRYFSWENFKDFFHVIKGLFDARKVILDAKKDTKAVGDVLVFSTGGFVSVPVAIAGRFLGVKVFIHEQTARAGLANRICGFFAHKVFISFEESAKYFCKKKTEYSGYPLRRDCFDKLVNPLLIKGKNILDTDRSVLLVTGGGNGSLVLNNLVGNNLQKLSTRFRIIHQVGKNFLAQFSPLQNENYYVFDFINEGMIDILKRADLVISRAGAGTVSELLAIGTPSIFIPLPHAQKNEQYYNALEAKNKIGSLIIQESELPNINFMETIDQFMKSRCQNITVQSQNGLDFLLKKIDSEFLGF
ncbi:MAG: undecaprenyldiphospho-muramoylpentapeptide beta-N-acetylglucosaminyltransferase [Bdellovibrio sp.]|nr:undecaprenyldiphospho-muramoylpentapeptide beta-N-acetylglucosaminyltransferase [Bdellovibrio sp.]